MFGIHHQRKRVNESQFNTSSDDDGLAIRRMELLRILFKKKNLQRWKHGGPRNVNAKILAAHLTQVVYHVAPKTGF